MRDEFRRLRQFERMGDLLVRRVRIADSQIFLDRSRKQHRLLKDDADVAAKRAQSEFADVDAVDFHRAAVWIEGPMQEPERR